MNILKSIFASLLTAIVIGGAVLAWRQHTELVALRAAKMSGGESDGHKQRALDLERRNRDLESQLAAQRATATTASPAGKPESKRADEGRTESTERKSTGDLALQTKAIRELTNTPQVQSLLSMQQKATIEQRYAALFKQLNLPPDQIEKLKTLLAERAATQQDVFAAAREQGINPREQPEAFQKLVADAQNQIKASLTAIIGENGLAQLTSFERTQPHRNVVNELHQRLSYTNTPLSSAQAEQLVQILAANPAQRQAPAPGMSGPAVATMVNNAIKAVPGVAQLLGVTDDSGKGPPGFSVSPVAVNLAQTVLKPEQLTALQQIQQQQQAQQQMRKIVTETLVRTQPVPPANVPPVSPPRKGG